LITHCEVGLNGKLSLSYGFVSDSAPLKLKM
jgi:hypothetical protein